MSFIINFFEYTLHGWVYAIWFILMIIFSLACLGIVGEKVSKKRLAELAALREKEAEEEYKKAQDLIERQAQNMGLDYSIDPTLNQVNQPNQKLIEQTAALQKNASTANANVDTTPKVMPVPPQPVATPTIPEMPAQGPVPSPTPVIDNTSEDAIKTEVPAVLVINDDGTSNT